MKTIKAIYKWIKATFWDGTAEAEINRYWVVFVIGLVVALLFAGWVAHVGIVLFSVAGTLIWVKRVK
ncbi:MAG: hypothetical protein IIB63_04685 [Proteobacteria bacterium]|nr:hypothetical protein [Pseudomonadota bacterium]